MPLLLRVALPEPAPCGKCHVRRTLPDTRGQAARERAHVPMGASGTLPSRPPPPSIPPPSRAASSSPAIPRGHGLGTREIQRSARKTPGQCWTCKGEEGVWDWYVPSLVGNGRREPPKKKTGKRAGAIFFPSPGWTRSFSEKIYIFPQTLTSFILSQAGDRENGGCPRVVPSAWWMEQ